MKPLKLGTKMREIAIKPFDQSRILCRVCDAELTSTDLRARECTQCKTAIPRPIAVQLRASLLERS